MFSSNNGMVELVRAVLNIGSNCMEATIIFVSCSSMQRNNPRDNYS